MSQRRVARRKYEETAGLLVADIARLMRARFHERARALGLTKAQWSVLNRVSHNEGITQSGLAELLEVEGVTVSRLIDSLERMGWLERRVDPEDGRVRQIFLAADVLPLLDRIDALGLDTEREAFAGLSSAEARQLLVLLQRVRGNLSAVSKKKWRG